MAAVLLRDVAASLGEHHGGVRAEAVEVDESGRFHLRAVTAAGSPVDTDRAPLAAPELFDGAAPDDGSDVYAAACLALTSYLGSSPVPATAVAPRASSRVRLGALRQAHRTVPARLGALPDPFRGVFAQAVAKQAHLRPSPAQLVALLDAAFAAAGPSVEADARGRVHRLVMLARVFVPVEFPAASPLAVVPLASVPTHAENSAFAALHLPVHTLPSFGRPRGVLRAALIAAVAIGATGGVAFAAFVGVGGGGPATTPQAVSTGVDTPSASPSVEPAAATSRATSATSTAPATTAPGGAVAGGGDQGGPSCLRVQGLVAVALEDDPTDEPTTPTPTDTGTPTPDPTDSSTPPTTPPSSTAPPAGTPTVTPPRPPAATTSKAGPVSTVPADPGGGSGSGSGGGSGSGSGGGSGNGSDGDGSGSDDSGC